MAQINQTIGEKKEIKRMNRKKTRKNSFFLNYMCRKNEREKMGVRARGYLKRKEGLRRWI
jgi:hypothetical protein